MKVVLTYLLLLADERYTSFAETYAETALGQAQSSATTVIVTPYLYTNPSAYAIVRDDSVRSPGRPDVAQNYVFVDHSGLPQSAS